MDNSGPGQVAAQDWDEAWTANGFWVFAYGSLLWNPGFEALETAPAVIAGYHRRFCLYSHRYRGSPSRPGLVLGLDRGGSCRGVAYRICPTQADAVRAYLWDREMSSAAYLARRVTARLVGSRIEALAFVVDRTHPQYAGSLSDDDRARIIANSMGERGSNRDYLDNTLCHLTTLGIRDRDLVGLAARVKALIACGDDTRPLPEYIEDWSI